MAWSLRILQFLWGATSKATEGYTDPLFSLYLMSCMAMLFVWSQDAAG